MQRFRSFVSLALLLCAGLSAVRAQGNAAGPGSAGDPNSVAGGASPSGEQPQQAPADPTFVKEFGPRDEEGSFRVRFDPRGAGVVYLTMLDHYVDVTANKKAEHDVAVDYQLLLWGGGDYSFYVEQIGAGGLFSQRLHVDAWEYEQGDDYVRFWIDSGNGLRLSKTFRHRPEHRGLGIEITLENTGAANVAGTFQFDLGGAVPVNPSGQTLFTNPAAAICVVQGAEPFFRKADKEGRKELANVSGARWTMAGSSNRFFGGFLYPLDDTTAMSVLRVDSLPMPRGDLDPKRGDADITKAFSTLRAILTTTMPVPAAGQKSTLEFGAYLGPKSFGVFDEQPEFEPFLAIMDVDLEPPCCVISVPGGRFMAKTLLKLLGWFESLVGNWGVAIMMLTLLVRGAMSPLNFRMQKSMRAFGAKMAKLKPKLDEIKQKYAGDPKAHQQAMMEFQREHKMIPPIGGCLPIFLTMPIYIGLFTALRTAYDLRQEGFMLWIDDLSRPDALFHVGIPFVENLNLLPLIWIGLIITLQLRMPLPTDPQQRQMQQIMRYMPVIFGVLLYNYASGLMVYMVTSMLWSLIESSVIRKILGPMDANASGMAPMPIM